MSKWDESKNEKCQQNDGKEPILLDKWIYSNSSPLWRTYMIKNDCRLDNTSEIRKQTSKLNEEILDKSLKFSGLVLNNNFPLMPLKTISLNNFNHQDNVHSNHENRHNKNIKMCLNFQELGCVRIPPICANNNNYSLVDRATGLNPGLVNGDYLRFEFVSKKKEKMVNSDVCLSGLKGMHFAELSFKRAKSKCWKFCFYQAITALLVKTQLRYKYARSGNLDYIYEHAWMLFIHTGLVNVKRRQRLNDVVVYNYKYNIELELVDELKDIHQITDFAWEKVGKFIKKKRVLNRKELMHIPGTLGRKRNAHLPKSPIHKTTKLVEQWFDKIDLSRYMNCIIKTDTFCLAFWRDGLFWYLYNPFRCNEFGFWDDYGSNCIMKFCSKESLKRHLIILLLFACSNKCAMSNFIKNDEDSSQIKGMAPDNNKENTEESKNLELKPKNNFTIKIFRINFNCCKIHDIKSCQNVGGKKAPISKIKINPELSRNEVKEFCLTGEREETGKIDISNQMENSEWLKKMTIPWLRFSNQGEDEKDPVNENSMWYQYYVEEKDKLFSLQTDISIEEEIFPQKNRGKQFYACYVICAGMTRLAAPEFWTSQTLNAILFFGDIYYTASNFEANHQKFQNMDLLNTGSFTNYLWKEFKIGNFAFRVKVLPTIYGQLYNKYGTCLWRAVEKCFLKYYFGILTCGNTCLGLFRHCNAYYVFNAQSIGSSSTFLNEKGTAFLLRTCYFYKFITSLILIIGSSKYDRFALNPIKISTILDLDYIGSKRNNKGH